MELAEYNTITKALGHQGQGTLAVDPRCNMVNDFLFGNQEPPMFASWQPTPGVELCGLFPQA
jgi:hypothetical protein